MDEKNDRKNFIDVTRARCKGEERQEETMEEEDEGEGVSDGLKRRQLL